MPAPTRLSIAKADIFRHFDHLPQKLFLRSELARELSRHRVFWRLALKTNASEFAQFLIKSGRLHQHTLKSPEYQKELIRYSWGPASVYEIALSIAKAAYLSHGSAVFLHGLTDLIPKTVYLNVEQSIKPPPEGGLTQQGLDRAFANQPRRSKLSYEWDSWVITIISGKNSQRLGVESVASESGNLAATDLERTLIDIAVRPIYGGGVVQVLEAYRAAKDRLSTNRLVAYLKRLNYAYPYAQSIGFLMERAGYDETRWSLLQELKSPLKFYLANGLVKPAYDERWQLFYPPALKG